MGFRAFRFLPLAFALFSALRVFGQAAVSEPSGADEEYYQLLKSNGVVYGAVVRDSTGAEIRRETYLRGEDGSLVEIVLKAPDGTITILGAAEDRQWMDGSRGDGFHRIFSGEGKLLLEEQLVDGRVARRDAYRYEGSPSRLVSLRREEPEEGTVLESFFDAAGLTVRETRGVRGKPEESILYSYDEEKRVTEIRNRVGRSETRTRFSYGPDGSEAEERFDSTGALLLRIEKNPDGTSVEEQYDGGVLFARVFFRDGVKTGQEILGPEALGRTGTSP